MRWMNDSVKTKPSQYSKTKIIYHLHTFHLMKSMSSNLFIASRSEKSKMYRFHGKRLGLDTETALGAHPSEGAEGLGFRVFRVFRPFERQ